MSLLWGVGGIILIHLLKPLIDTKISKIPKYFTYSLCFLFVIDIVLSIIFKH